MRCTGGLRSRIASPLLQELGFGLRVVAAASSLTMHALLCAGDEVVASLVVTAWGHDLSAAWRDAVLHGIGHGVRWCFCVTGPTLRIVDAERTYSRRFAQFDSSSRRTRRMPSACSGACCARMPFGGRPCCLDRAVALSEQHRASVRLSLQEGVHDALAHLLRAFAATRRARRRTAGAPISSTSPSSLSTVCCSCCSLRRADSCRGGIPCIARATRLNRCGRSSNTAGEPLGLWESLQAIARLAHRGCRAGSLRVPPFNGRLFSPAHAPLAESAALDDAAVRQALLALTTRNTRWRGGSESRMPISVSSSWAASTSVCSISNRSSGRWHGAGSTTRSAAKPRARSTRPAH